MQRKEKEKEKEPVKEKATPYEVPRMFNPDNDEDIIMEERPKKKKVTKETAATPREGARKQPEIQTMPPPGARNPLKSELQKSVNPETVMTKVLDTTVTLSIREVLAMSGAMSKALIDMLRFTRSTPLAGARTGMIGGDEEVADEVEVEERMTYSLEMERDDARLIIVRIYFENGDSCDAIVDCGSEINVMDSSTAARSSAIINKGRKLMMKDANGGSQRMEGLVQGWGLKLGPVMTQADVWVGRVPFRLLLGRPWLRRNRVSMDEREDGTYLIFKHYRDESQRFEMNALPAGKTFGWEDLLVSQPGKPVSAMTSFCKVIGYEEEEEEVEEQEEERVEIEEQTEEVSGGGEKDGGHDVIVEAVGEEREEGGSGNDD
jgi:hypothetical protein